MLDQTIGDTLALVNVARVAFGAPELTELPDARPGDSQDCLYYRALKDIGCEGVSGPGVVFSTERAAKTVAMLWGTEAQGYTVHSPESVRRIVHAFDGKEDITHYNV